jgi:hypothetical protein
MRSTVDTETANTETADTEFEQFLGNLWGRFTDTGSADATIVDRTSLTPKNLRKGTRKKVYALVLHQMAFNRGNDRGRYDTVPAHFAILQDGTILQLHPEAALLWTSNGFNAGSVGVEFAGNFPNTKGRCWNSKEHGCHQVTPEQIAAGRRLVRYLIKKIGLTHILTHRQAHRDRENDPGPDIWAGVGQWAVDQLGLNDGGPGFKIDSGNPIPDEWRTWKVTAMSKESEVTYPPGRGSYAPSGTEDATVRAAIRGGVTSENALTDLVFFRRYPGRAGRPISRGEPGYAQLSQEWLRIRDTLVRPILRGAPSAPSPGPVPAPAPGVGVTPGTPDVVTVRGITVARKIASQVQALLAAAEADGVRLGGSGFRSPTRQIELRKQNCGTSQYDIYEKSASLCDPPTARPGTSMHEQGLALDLQHNGAKINSHQNPGYRWLAANAARYGMFNLPSEPWHWSVNGK